MNTTLQSYAAKYRRNLEESVIPFWLKHSLDWQHDGQFTCLDRDGTLWDTKKYLWLQGRAAWMFARLYNEWERRPEYLEAARRVVDFIRQHAFDERGRVWFSVTREGRPFAFQRKPYGAVFCMMGLLEYARATGDADCHRQAVALFWRIEEWLRQPELIDRPPLSGQAPVSNLANQMVMACMALELARVDPDPRYRQMIRDGIDGVLRHRSAEHGVLLETVALDGSSLRAWPEGRLFSPGHSIEVAWFLLHMLEYFPDATTQRVALDILDRSLQTGWDQQYGGLYYLRDIEGKPTLPLEHNMKLWWPVTEAIYALVLAHGLNPEDRWVRWLEQVDAYAFDHFVDKEQGEWFGYCDRRGELTSSCKGNNYKGFFHVPRALMLSVQRIEQTLKEKTTSSKSSSQI